MCNILGCVPLRANCVAVDASIIKDQPNEPKSELIITSAPELERLSNFQVGGRQGKRPESQPCPYQTQALYSADTNPNGSDSSTLPRARIKNPSPQFWYCRFGS